MKYSNAIVRQPCQEMINGLSTANLGTPDFEKAVRQHGEYVKALQACGLQVTILSANHDYPDSVFVEDTALLTPECAIITNPGAESRKGETQLIIDTIKSFYLDIEKINPPGTVEAGDIMMTENHCYIGISARTNLNGARQIIDLLGKYGTSASSIVLKEVLHLKTGISYLENNNLLATGEFMQKPELESFNIIPVPQEESFAANSLWVNGKVLVPAGFPKTLRLIQQAGYETLPVDVSEFRKLDGGLSCLSLRF